MKIVKKLFSTYFKFSIHSQNCAEELVEEGVEEASIEVVVDLAAVDALGHELEDGVEGHLLIQRVKRMNRDNYFN